jgi:hypothetical protein
MLSLTTILPIVSLFHFLIPCPLSNRVFANDVEVNRQVGTDCPLPNERQPDVQEAGW